MIYSFQKFQKNLSNKITYQGFKVIIYFYFDEQHIYILYLLIITMLFIILMDSQSQTHFVTSPQNNSMPVLLIYYNFRGIGQMIRYLLRYLKVAYIDILLDEYEEQKKTLPPAVLNLLRSKSIKTNDLPAIIHNHEIVYELNQVMNYICITFNREDLLGVDLFQKAHVCEVQELYSARLANNIRFLSGFVANIHKTELDGEDLLAFVEEKVEYFFGESGYFRELSTLLLQQEVQAFVFKNITIVDFYFIETCRFAVGLFSSIDQQLARGKWISIARDFKIHQEARGKAVRNVANLRAMKKYIDFLTSQSFYQKNQKYFESFKQFPKSMSGEQSEGMKVLEANYFLDLYYDNGN